MAGKDLQDVPFLLVGSAVAAREELLKAADAMVEKGKSLTPEGRKKAMSQKKGLVSKGDEFSMVVARTVQRSLENTGLATKSDLEELDRKVDLLERRVTGKVVVVRPTGKKQARKKPARKKAAKKKSTPAKAPAKKKSTPAKAPAKKKASAKKAPAAKKAAAPVKPAEKPVEKPIEKPVETPVIDVVVPDKAADTPAGEISTTASGEPVVIRDLII
jgi:polyhydroxyalkanoate synthesis regulator phasin